MAFPATAPPATIGEVLSEGIAVLRGASVEPVRLTAEMLLAHAVGTERIALQTHPEREVAAAAAACFTELVRRRAAGEPVQHLVGRQEFFGRDFAVSPDVLIPRPETEILVEAALDRIGDRARVLDLATGSGAIAVTLKLERPAWNVRGSDVSAAALAKARDNARRLGAAVSFVHADWLTAFRPGSFDVVVSNPPYIAESARPGLQREVLADPHAALFAGADGLDAYRALIPQAERLLTPSGILMLELGHDSLPAVRALLEAGAWTAPEIVDDLAGAPRTLIVRRAASA